MYLYQKMNLWKDLNLTNLKKYGIITTVFPNFKEVKFFENKAVYFIRNVNGLYFNIHF